MARNKNNFKTAYAISLAWQLGFLIAVPIIAFLALGFWADGRLGTEPLLLVFGLFVGMAVTAYEVYHLLAPLMSGEEPHDEH
jgi:F0F1-type ATP synthase assembly protein I